MLVESRVGCSDQPSVEPALVSTTLVTAHQKDRLPLRIEGKGYPPDATIPIKAQLLHVGVPRTFQAVYSGPAKIRSELGEQSRMGQQFVRQAFRKRLEFGIESIVEQDHPAHRWSMDWK